MDVAPRDDAAIDVESLATKYPVVDWKTHILNKNMMYYQIIKANGSSKYYKIFSEILDDFDRQDVIDLHRMLNRRLEVDYESEMAFELLRFTRSQLQNLGEDCWELKASEITTVSFGEQKVLQDLQNNDTNNTTTNNTFYPTGTYNDFLDQMLSGGKDKLLLPWDLDHFDDQSAFCSSYLRQHHITGGGHTPVSLDVREVMWRVVCGGFGNGETKGAREEMWLLFKPRNG
ncbi:hypothetical protein Tco_0801155 [Tanacetum coccineum]|uniref:Uncharacterized protein n=1 Tax=Tanacetum coccineum TaxID=301880 RepID=A0ABQ4ZW27_9ASTR